METYPLPLEHLLQHSFTLVQPTEPVDFLLVLAPDFVFVTRCSLLFFGELGRLLRGVFVEKRVGRTMRRCIILRVFYWYA